MKVVEQSLYDVAFKQDGFLPEATDFQYNEEYYEDFHDVKLSGNILKHINADAFGELKQTVTGHHVYYEVALFKSNQ